MNTEVIIQSECDDISTVHVQDWLYYIDTKSKILRLNNCLQVSDTDIFVCNEKTNMHIYCNSQTILLDNNAIDWYRRGSTEVFFQNSLKLKECIKAEESKIDFSSILMQDLYLSRVLLKNAYSNNINCLQNSQNDKISNIIMAKSCDIKIPATIVTNKKKVLSNFLNFYPDAITKPLNEKPFSILIDDFLIEVIGNVQFIDKKTILSKKTSEKFGYSLFQEYIQKKYELRVFYIKGTFFTMAIFSQENEKTKIDYRNFDENKLNRCTPYELPVYIKERIKKFMDLLDLNCGSLDLIVSPNDEYYFLEVNPIGQYEWVEKNCNYNVSQIIAKTLYEKKQG